MRQPTLNIIAIAVFVITLVSLLGPLVNWSPTVPAIATVGLIGLVAIDQVGLEGRLGNLVVDGLSWMSPDHRQRVLYHEAGHFLAACLLEIPITAYSLNTWEAWRRGIPGQGGVIFDTEVLEAEIAQGKLTAGLVDRYGKVWMAGIAAEEIVYGSALGGQDDQTKFRLLWEQLDRPQAEGQMKLRWSALQAKNLLDQHRDALFTLVPLMESGAPVADCVAAIRASISPESPDSAH